MSMKVIFFGQFFLVFNMVSVPAVLERAKQLLIAAASILLFGCGSLPNTPDTKLTELESSIYANREILDQQQLLLDSLASIQIESSEALRTELLRTRLLLQGYIQENNQSTSVTSSENTENTDSKTRAEWLLEEGKIIVGGIENITLTMEEVTYEARVDTGATSSSLDAREITPFERDGDRWVRFKLFLDEEHHTDVERPVVRWVRIFQSGTEEGDRRPVVEMDYRFGDIVDTAEFTLTDRSHLEFPALIGRNIMTDRMIVDVSDSHLFHAE